MLFWLAVTGFAVLLAGCYTLIRFVHQLDREDEERERAECVTGWRRER